MEDLCNMGHLMAYELIGKQREKDKIVSINVHALAELHKNNSRGYDSALGQLSSFLPKP